MVYADRHLAATELQNRDADVVVDSDDLVETTFERKHVKLSNAQQSPQTATGVKSDERSRLKRSSSCSVNELVSSTYETDRERSRQSVI